MVQPAVPVFFGGGFVIFSSQCNKQLPFCSTILGWGLFDPNGSLQPILPAKRGSGSEPLLVAAKKNWVENHPKKMQRKVRLEIHHPIFQLKHDFSGGFGYFGKFGKWFIILLFRFHHFAPIKTRPCAASPWWLCCVPPALWHLLAPWRRGNLMLDWW